MDTVTVIIPCFNHGHFLPTAIESVRMQSIGGDADIVVVDDGSTDDPATVARRYGARCVRQTNQGLAAARNRGLAESTSRYVVFLDADDRLLPNHFECSLRAFEEHPEAMWVTGDYRWFNDAGAWHRHDCRPRPDHYASLLRFNIVGAIHTAMFKRELFDLVGGFYATLRSCEDQELWLRIARRYPLSCHHEVVAEYRRTTGQLSQQWDVMLHTAMRMLREQRAYVRAHPQYREAYRSGIRFRQRLYGEPLVWQTLTAIKAGQWRHAGRNVAALLRDYPQALALPFQQKWAALTGRMRALAGALSARPGVACRSRSRSSSA